MAFNCCVVSLFVLGYNNKSYSSIVFQQPMCLEVNSTPIRTIQRNSCSRMSIFEPDPRRKSACRICRWKYNIAHTVAPTGAAVTAVPESSIEGHGYTTCKLNRADVP
jgi:hypothetical protein